MDPHVEPHRDAAALLTIDVQRDFAEPGAPAEVPGTMAAAERMAHVVQAFRDHGAPIVHVVRLYRRDGSNVDRCRRSAIDGGETVVAPGSDGAELVDELTPTAAPQLDPDRLLGGEFQPLGEGERAMYKPRWGAFYDTPLASHLDGLGVDTLVVVGCNFPNCPRTTVYEASERDYRVLLVADAVSGTYERGLEELADIGVAVTDAAAAVGWLAGEAAASGFFSR